MTADRLEFLSVKAFGDFTIALTSLERNASGRQSNGLSILAARHLAPLMEALSPRIPVRFLQNREPGVPALFDIRKAGPVRAIASAWNLQRTVASRRDRNARLVLDHGGVRERWLGGPHRVEVLPRCDNIYLGYSELMKTADTGRIARAPMTPDGGTIGIFPGSRLPVKNLPAALVADLLRRTTASGRSARLLLLDGERPDLAVSGLPHEIVPRDFAAMDAAIRSVDRVISADSLPAHLAERADKPVFVVSPRPNAYWLPLSSFTGHHWTTFSDSGLGAQVNRFLGA